MNRNGPWPFNQEMATRWLDNDQYGHLNNSSYYLLADSIINTYLIRHCGITPYHPGVPPDDVIGLVISSSARYFAATSFPTPLNVGLRVIQLGTSSVTYQVGIHQPGEKEAAVVAQAKHVFVHRKNRRPVKVMPIELREGLQKLQVQDNAKL